MVKIIFDDTDVFALACSNFQKEAVDVMILMEPIKSGRIVTDIGATVKKREPIMKSLLAARLIRL